MTDEHDHDARFTRLYSAYYGTLLAYARRQVDQGMAEDVVQKTFEIAWRRLDEVPAGESALPWLYCQARGEVANRRRWHRRFAEFLRRLEAQATPPGNGSAPPDLDGIFEAARACLSAADREALQLRYWEELTIEEAAVIAGCTPNAMAVRVHRARVRLEHHLLRLGYGGLP
ncbi:RNA polymerase sigma factor [Acrocarpospora catenulata]|uniref:RNA polymerase sigma factor n=1 Tax=Acrocarpospora catenulata TaxID=2836182 RepID=UPI001BDA9ACB|nr:sigma-70 family RNA polymerase sigma factor [Acrocarpospora catenulata]